MKKVEGVFRCWLCVQVGLGVVAEAAENMNDGRDRVENVMLVEVV